MNQVITANRLRDGIVVFLGTGEAWVEQIGAATIFASPEMTEAGLVTGKAAERDNLVIDAYAIDVSHKNGVVLPTRLREAIRASGPTIHPEHGKGEAA